MPWKRFQFKDQVVFARVLADGKPIVRNGLVEIRYRLGATKSYRGSRDTLIEIEGEGLVEDAEMGGTTATAAAATAIRETPTKPADGETIVIYTDGACSGNPGPAGIGVFMKHPTREIELAEYIGSATNNIAEAFLQAATQAPQPMHCAASMARSAAGFGTGKALASGALPVRTETKPPA